MQKTKGNYLTFICQINFYNAVDFVLYVINVVLFFHLKAICSIKLFALQSDMFCKAIYINLQSYMCFTKRYVLQSDLCLKSTKRYVLKSDVF